MTEFFPFDERCILASIAESQVAATTGKMPFGAVVTDSQGNILARAHNQCRAAPERGGNKKGGDVTRHAEMELLRTDAFVNPPDDFTDEPRSQWTVYSSTEPCVMCAGALYWSGVGRVVFGCSAKQLEVVSGPGGFDIELAKLYGMAAPGSRSIRVVGPYMADQALQVHRESGVWGGGAKKEQEEKPTTTTAADRDIAVEASLKTTGLGSAAVRDDGVVPTIDLSALATDREKVAQELWQAATTVGFFSVVGHGIPASTIDDAFADAETFFAQPVADKERQSPGDMKNNAGFEHFSQVRPSTGVKDQKESLQVTARAGCMDGRWPSESFETKTQALLKAAHKLANQLLDLLEPLATPHLPPNTLSKSHTLWADDGQCTLRYLHYPAMPQETTDQLLKEGYWRAGPHTDWDNVTLLFQRPGQSGLECCANPRTADPEALYWTAVKPVEGGIAVNIGDMLARWSNHKVYSNLHRVRLPADASKPRYSIAFFAQSDKKTVIDNGKDEAITAGDYILSRIQSNFQSPVKK